MPRARAAATSAPPRLAPLPKSPSGITGLDQITAGGLPRGRPTLVCGAAGCGKTLLSMQFLVRGILDHGEPGVFMAFEETAEDLAANVAALGYDLQRLVASKRLVVDHVRVERHEIEETGSYDLEALFIRLAHAIDAIGAKRVVLDSIEALFGVLSDGAILRAELRRLFRWLKDRGITALITGERGHDGLTRHGLEEYVADCVILLDHRVEEQISTRRVRVVKYRGSPHDTNEFPFLIDEHGLSVLPITSAGLDSKASTRRISSGVARLDAMLGGEGYFRGSSILVSGTAGTGKSSLAAHFAAAACRGGGRCLYFAFEESEDQILRNMRSIGIDLRTHLRSGRLRIRAARSTLQGLEMHLASMYKLIADFRPDAVVLDPISNFIAAGTSSEVKAMLTRLIDLLKNRGITSVFTSLTFGGSALEHTETTISSLMDTWILLRTYEQDGERNRGLGILKSRGMPHSNQIREFVLGNRGLELLDVYLGPDGMLMGSARVAREARARDEDLRQRQLARRSERDTRRRRSVLEAQVAALTAELEAVRREEASALDGQEASDRVWSEARTRMARARSADAS